MKPMSKPLLSPLFPVWVTFLAVVFAELWLFIQLIPLNAVSGWSLASAVRLALTLGLTIGVVLEMVRHRFRMSLRLVFAMVTAVALVCILAGARLVSASKQRTLASEVRSLGGNVMHDIQWTDPAFLETRDGWLVPNWLVDVLGIDFFAAIEQVSFSRGNPSDSELAEINLPGIPTLRISSDRVSDESLDWICRQESLKCLWIERTNISAGGLQRLRHLPNLEGLILFGVPADYDVNKLATLTQLKYLIIRQSRLPGDAVEVLHRLLPACEITHHPN